MLKNNIDDYDIFIFDFDGTVLDTEYYHYSSYIESFKFFNKNIELDENNYFRLLHNIDKTEFYEYLKEKNINNYEKLYELKSENYNKYINNQKINNIGNIDKFLQKIKNKNKKIIMITNSSIKSINIFKEKYSIINYFDEIYTKENFTKKKPDPECYKIVAEKYKNYKMIGFEDSYPGFHALSLVKEIKPFHIKSLNYYYNDKIEKDYNVNIIENYDCFD